MQLSIIIPTCNRPQSLKDTLESIFGGSCIPDHIIIVDQSSDKDTETIVQSLADDRIDYYHFPIQSGAQARNFAMSKLDKQTDIVLFLDDDVSVDLDCLAQISNYMIDHDNIYGGVLHIQTPSRTISLIKKIGFFLLTGTIQFTEQFVSKGGFNAMFLSQPNKQKSVQRCSGCGMFFRKSLLDQGFRFPDSMLKYSLMEDVFFSYAIYRQYPESLIYLPQAKIIHHESPLRSIPTKAKIMQNIVHRFLFVQTFGLSYISYVWTIFLLAILDLITYKHIKIVLWYIQGLSYIWKNRKLLSLDGSAVDYNIFIFSE